MPSRPFCQNSIDATSSLPDVSTLRATAHLSGCTNPVRLYGRLVERDLATGSWNSIDERGVYVPCKNRRASVCEPCSKTYQGDAFQLIRAGLQGGKGVPSEVAERPALFVTLTAPSFGAVHGTAARCRPRRGSATCAHGQQIACWERHRDEDPLVGQPLCKSCFDYEGAVLWNGSASELFRRTRVTLERIVAGRRARSKKGVRVQYVKVAEFQRRGLVHFHMVMRYDGDESAASSLEDAIRQAVRTTAFHLPNGRRIAWGSQVDIRDVAPDNESAESASLNRGQIAGYLAKYATKDTESLGTLNRRVSIDDVSYLRVSPHVRELVRTALTIAKDHRTSGPGNTDMRLDAWAHQFGFRGHFLTKSLKWSTTFAALRQARSEHRRQLCKDSWAALRPETRHQIEARWNYVGRGYRSIDEHRAAEMHRRRPAIAA